MLYRVGAKALEVVVQAAPVELDRQLVVSKALQRSLITFVASREVDSERCQGASLVDHVKLVAQKPGFAALLVDVVLSALASVFAFRDFGELPL